MRLNNNSHANINHLDDFKVKITNVKYKKMKYQ